MKTIITLALLAAAVSACTSATHPNASKKCHDELGLAYNTTEYNDCVEKMATQEGAIAGSKNLH